MKTNLSVRTFFPGAVSVKKNKHRIYTYFFNPLNSAKYVIKLFLLFFILTSVINVYSQGFTSVFSKNDTNVVAVGGSTIFTSTDGGANWSSKTVSGSSFYAVWAHNSNIWITDQSNNSVYKSTDNGSTWNSYIVTGMTKIYGIFFDGDNDGWVSGSYGIYRSTNGGVNWSAQSVPVTDTYTSVKFYPTPSMTQFDGVACGKGGTLLYTTNGGVTWHALPSTINTGELISIDIKGRTAIATGADGFIMKSTNSGVSYSRIDYGILTQSRVNGVSMVSPDTFYTCGGGGFIRESTDTGGTFTFQLNPMMADLYSIYFHDSQHGWAASSKNQAVLRTTDGGSHWLFPDSTTITRSLKKVLSPAIGNFIGNSLARSPKNKNEMFVVNGIYIYRSLDLGDTWALLDSISPSYSNFLAHTFYVSLNDTNTFLASLEEFGGTGKVVRSTDYGHTWKPVWSGTLSDFGVPLAIDPNYSGIFYLVPSGGKMLRTTNNGTNWTEWSNNKFNTCCDIIVTYKNSDLMYLGEYDSTDTARLYKSYDNGVNWTNIFSPRGSGGEVPMIGFNNLDTNSVFITNYGENGFWRSTNAGVNWSKLDANTSTWGCDVAKDDPNVVAYGTYGGNIHISTNDGNSFVSLNPSADNTNYGVYYYDRGNILFMQSTLVYKLQVSYDVASSSATLNVNKAGDNIPHNFNLSQNFPNPFNPTTQIHFDIPKQSLVTLKVYNVLGQLVDVLVNNELKTAGRYELSFDGTKLASGVYYYRISAGDFTDVKKMVLLK